MVKDSKVAEPVEPPVSRWAEDGLERGAIEALCPDATGDSDVNEQRRSVPACGLDGVECLNELLRGAERDTPSESPGDERRANVPESCGRRYPVRSRGSLCSRLGGLSPPASEEERGGARALQESGGCGERVRRKSKQGCLRFV